MQLEKVLIVVTPFFHCGGYQLTFKMFRLFDNRSYIHPQMILLTISYT